ncbi:MAG: hypothetical protein HN390_01450 [Anaerolineae bacterium]|jgi:hypothetical protein|nr:hypothetical protein [Anaerolineae bacterium]MBT7192119.1 hypothetical protein [Anaerolineae bacterium]
MLTVEYVPMPPEQVAAYWAAMQVVAELIMASPRPPAPIGASPQIGRASDLGGNSEESECPGKDGALQLDGEAVSRVSVAASSIE